MRFDSARNILAGLVAAIAVAACGPQPAPSASGEDKIGILVVAHGSESRTWNGMIESLIDEVRTAALAQPGIADFRLAYITASKPSIAREMRRFDAEGFDEVVVIPLLIAEESARTNVYLQYLAGMRAEAATLRQLQNEGYEIYHPRARVTMVPALSKSNVLKRNALRRVQALQGDDDGASMAVLLVGYGDRQYGQQMEELLEGIGRFLKLRTSIDTVAFAFCGELVDYSGAPVVEAINELLELEDQVLVVPVLLAVDEKLQRNTILAGVNAVEVSSKVRYRQDAVLPDPEINKWLLDSVEEISRRLTQ